MRRLTIERVVIVACFYLATLSYADIGISWQSSAGAYAHGENFVSGPWPNSSGLRQLLWSSLDPTTLVPDAGAVNYLDANSFLLFTYSSATAPTNDGAVWSASDVSASVLVFSNANVSGNNINNGYLYSRIFQDLTPTNGMWYLQSAPVGAVLTAYDPLNPLSTITYDSTPGEVAFELNQQVIPEPATWAFMGLGMLAIVIRRLRK